MNLILSLLMPILKSMASGIQYNSAEPFFYGVRKLVIIIAAGIIIIVLIVLAVKYLIRIRNIKAKDD